MRDQTARRILMWLTLVMIGFGAHALVTLFKPSEPQAQPQPSESIKASAAMAAAPTKEQYTVKSGDSMWKIAVMYQIGLDEIIAANPQIKNPTLIYPNQKITVPNIDDVKRIEGQVVNLVNVERQRAGLSKLAIDWEISRIARYKSRDMAVNNYFSHQSPTYGSPFEMLRQFGISYRSAGENIAKGQRTPADVMHSWMNSAGHRANILNTAYDRIGVGYYVKGGVNYWTQVFIKH